MSWWSGWVESKKWPMANSAAGLQWSVKAGRKVPAANDGEDLFYTLLQLDENSIGKQAVDWLSNEEEGKGNG